MKQVGSRKLVPASPVEALLRAERLIAEANRLAPHPKPRGFVFKAKTWDEIPYLAAGASQPEALVMEPAESSLLHVCRLLNAKKAEYLVAGAWA